MRGMFYFICFLFYMFYFILYVLFLYVLFLFYSCKRISKQRDAGSESTHVVMLSQMYIKCILNLLLDFKELVCITCMYKIYIHTI